MATRMLRLVEVEPEAPSWLSRMKAAFRSFTIPPRPTSDPELAKLFGEGVRTTAGISVTPEKAFTYSAVKNAVLQIGNDVAKLPLKLRKLTQNGGSEDYRRSKLYKLLKTSPNPETSSFELRRTITAHALTCHGGYAEIERDGAGRPVALWVLTPDRVRPFREKLRSKISDYELGPLKYEIDGKTVLDARDIIHIHGLGYDGYAGYETIHQARQSIGLALAAENAGAAVFGNGSAFGSILSTEMDLDEETAKAQLQLIEQYHRGSDKWWKILALPGGWKLMQNSIDFQKAQMKELREAQIEEVARFFRLPPYRLGLNKPGTVSYASVEMANLEYYQGALLDWITTWEQELNRKLIPELESEQQFIKHNVDAFLRADFKTRVEGYVALHNIGAMSADEIRELEDWNPQPDGIGKMYLVQGAQVPKNKIEAIADSTIKKNETPPPAPAPPKNDDDARNWQAEIDSANEKARLAEEAAQEARADAQREREAKISAEASGTASAAEIERLTTSQRDAEAHAAQMTVLAESLRSDVNARQAALDASQAELVKVTESRVFFEKEHDAAVARAKAADERADQSDVAAKVARTQLEAEIVARTAAESARSEADAKWESASAALSDATARSSELTVHKELADAAVVEARAEVLRLTQEVATISVVASGLGSDRDALVAERDAVQKELEGAEHLAKEYERQRDRVSLELESVNDALTRARNDAATALADSNERVGLAEAAAAREQQARSQAEALVEQAKIDAEEARTAVEAANRERDRMSAHLAEAEARAKAESEAAAKYERLEKDAEEATRAALAERDAVAEQARLAADEARAAIDAATAARDQASAKLAEAIQNEAEANAKVDARLEQQRAAMDNAAAILSAHRALIADVMRRMIDRECDRMRRAQQSPEKLNQAIETFYGNHEELCVTALLPAIRVHLAWMGSSEDPESFTKRLAAQHVEKSIRQLRTVLDGDAGELAVSVTRLLGQWETGRVDEIANVVLQRGIDHARGDHS